MSDIHLFLLVPNDSGSTWLQNIISQCANCISFSEGLDGKGVCAGTNAYPGMSINKLFSENLELWSNPGNFYWSEIKSLWFEKWSENLNYQSADPRVYLEKTPMSIFIASQLVEQFNNVRFIIMNRNPYAVVEGMRRTIPEEVSIERCAAHWSLSARQQLHNLLVYKDISLGLTYEELVNSPKETERKIKEFIPELHDLDLSKPAAAHSLEGTDPLPLMDFNTRHINNLNNLDIGLINKALVRIPEVLEHFGYELMIVRERYSVGQEEIDRQREAYQSLELEYVPFALTDEQLLELGRRFYLCLTTQDYETRIHDYPIDETSNKPWKYLQEFEVGTKILLVGTGAGREVLMARDMGFDAYGVTMGSKNINFGREVLGIDSSQFVGSCNELLPFPPETFDVVAGFQILEHAVSPLLFLLEQSRVLKDNGKIILEWPAASNHSTHGADPQHQVCYTPGQAEGLLLKAGFDNIELFYQDMSSIPKENYWMGEQEKGYVVAKAQKVNFTVTPEGDLIGLGYLNRFRNIGKDNS